MTSPKNTDNLHDKLRGRYEATQGGGSFKDSLSEILKMIDVKQKKVLDVGCGRGEKTYAYLQNGANFVLGLDFSLLGLIRAKEGLTSDNASKIKFVVGDAEKLPVKSDLFDLTILSEVLEHLQDMELAINEIKRVTKNNGQILITAPSYFNLTGLFKMAIDKFKYKGEERWTGHGVEVLEHRLTPFKLKRLLKKNNLSILQFKGRDLWNGIRPLFRIPFLLIINFFDFVMPRLFRFLQIEKLTRIFPFKYFGEDQYIKAEVKKILNEDEEKD